MPLDGFPPSRWINTSQVGRATQTSVLRPRSPSFPRCKAAFLPAWCVAAPAPHLCALLQVKKAGSRVVFLLVDKETAKCHSEQKTQFKRETASLKLLPHQPRVVVIQKGSNGYGFYLRAGPEQKGETQDSRPSPRVPPPQCWAIKLLPHRGAAGE